MKTPLVKIVINMKEIIYIVIPTIISAVVGYIVGLRRENVDLCGQRLDALEKSIGVYNTIIEDMSTKIDALKKEINKLEIQIQDLLKENKNLKKHNGL